MSPPLVVLAVACLLTAAPPASAEWSPGQPLEQELEPGEVRRHVVSLQPGEFVRVTVVQSGIDVTLRVLGPDGAGGPVVDAAEGPRGWELASILAAKAGEHAIEVRAAPDASAPGRYVVDSDAARPVTEPDQIRLIAESARARSGPGLRIRGQAMTAPQSVVLESERQLEVAAALFGDLGETCVAAESLSQYALLVGWASRERTEVVALHARAMVLWERCDDPAKRAEAHGYAAEGYRRVGHHARAVELYESGLALARRAGARDLELMLLTNMGGALNIIGETDKAIRCANEALPLLRAAGNRQGEAVALRNLALGHIRQGDFQQAAERALESLALRREIDDQPGQQATLVTLAEVYYHLAEPAAARRYLEEAQALAAGRFTNPGGWPRVLMLLARVDEQVGDRASALENLESALALHQRFQSPYDEYQTLLSLGRMHLRAGGLEAAREAAWAAEGLVRAAEDRHALADALELQGAAGLGLGDARDARASLEEALALRRETRDVPGEAIAEYQLARIDRIEGNAQSARNRLEDSLRLVEEARSRIVSPDLRSSWVGSVREIHEAYVETLMDLHRRDAGAGWDVRAFEASESARARSLLDLLAESRADIRQGVEPELLARERSLLERLNGRLELQLRQGSAPRDAAAQAELAREIRALSTEHEEVRARLRAASPRYAALTQPERLSLADVRAQVLDAETLLLEYGLGPERSHLWVVGRDVFASYVLPGQAAIEDLVRRARDEVQRRPSDEGTALVELSRMLLGPARTHLGTRRLLFVADGPLHHVPFGALADGGGRPLVVSHEVVSAPSASVVAQLRKGTRARPQRTLAVLADPVFDREDGRVQARAPGKPMAVASRGALERATRDFGFDGGRLPRLPYTRREAESILVLAPRGSGRLAVDFEASRATITEPELKDYRIVHFATHGLLNDVRPELSGLVLSLVDPQGRELSGLLMAPDVFNLELNAELVVLSGCRTALGKEIRGEGLIGLTRAFMYAGVPRVVASLWPVEDLATAELMKRFYEGMLGPARLRPAAALRRAQAEMAAHRRWSAPYYWAGFELQGDWR